MSDKDPTSSVHHAVELPARLVFSLLPGAVRVAARVEMPLGRLTELLRTAYFLEYRRRHPRDLSTVADKLGVSVRTAGTLNQSLDDAFFRPETRVEPVRQITGKLLGAPASLSELEAKTGMDPVEVRRVITHLEEMGWVEVEGDTAHLSIALRVYLTEDFQRRIDGVNHQLAIVADSVWSRFVHEDRSEAGARSWAFVARPEDVTALVERTVATLRDEAVALEEAALDEGIETRFGMTVAIAPLEEDP